MTALVSAGVPSLRAHQRMGVGLGPRASLPAGEVGESGRWDVGAPSPSAPPHGEPNPCVTHCSDAGRMPADQTTLRPASRRTEPVRQPLLRSGQGCPRTRPPAAPPHGEPNPCVNHCAEAGRDARGPDHPPPRLTANRTRASTTAPKRAGMPADQEDCHRVRVTGDGMDSHQGTAGKDARGPRRTATAVGALRPLPYDPARDVLRPFVAGATRPSPARAPEGVEAPHEVRYVSCEGPPRCS